MVLFSRDLRVHDHPALASAVRDADAIVPLFVFDDAIVSSDFARPNRMSFLVASLMDLKKSLEGMGGDLIVRRGNVVDEAMRVMHEAAASAIYVSSDVSAYAGSRERRLANACRESSRELKTWPGVTVVPAGAITPAGGDHFKVFSPYWRKWQEWERRAVLAVPKRISVPSAVGPGAVPPSGELVGGEVSPELVPGGETEGRRRAEEWLEGEVAGYEAGHDDLPGDFTSRLSPYVHFGCLSPLELAEHASSKRSAGAFVRQLCWRDFYHQVYAATPDLARRDYRPRGDRWGSAGRALERWKQGRTGFPIVDAGMRQLLREGWMHNRARLITASFLTKDLYIDWRLGARHFWDLLVDGDMANNAGNWQWVAGTGNDTRPNRIFNPIRQAHRFDPDGHYVRRYVPELRHIPGRRVHEPWKLGPEREGVDYPEPMVDHGDAAAAFRAKRAAV